MKKLRTKKTPKKRHGKSVAVSTVEYFHSVPRIDLYVCAEK